MIDLQIVATPIGNFGDITIRAKEALEKADFIVCEHEKEYRKLFFKLGLELKEFVLCTKKNEYEAIELVFELFNEGKQGVLISDCGTPLFEDPGYNLIQAVRAKNYKVSALPGPSSLITALSLSPFKITDFYFASFLPVEKGERESRLKALLKRKEAIILFETPYRLKNILELLKRFCGERRVYLPFNLTMESEMLFWGKAGEVLKRLEKAEIDKGEFIIFIEGLANEKKRKKR